MSIELTVTAKGRVTLRREILAHLGIRPGDKLVVDLLPDGRAQIHAKSGLSIMELSGALKRPEQPVLTIEEMNDAIAASWTGER
ncbi:MAG: AbrB/MazE/SpoVT family DNA-binding domain-containing protein [Azospirillaceae bacterium]|nr:AbrB/MazE/SpoVT family DNA-binding domain-containing protein [Azospirillaceae bacterium]